MIFLLNKININIFMYTTFYLLMTILHILLQLIKTYQHKHLVQSVLPLLQTEMKSKTLIYIDLYTYVA
jgi:hypothetical protein